METQPMPQPTGNPILDNPTLKAAFIAARGGAPPSSPQPMPAPGSVQSAPPIMGAIRHPEADQGAPAGPQPLPSGSVPIMPPSSQPQVKAPRGTVTGDEAERSRLLSTGSGISQIAHNIE